MAFRLPNEIRRLADAIHGNKVDTGFEATPGILQGNETIKKFIMGGNATFTIVHKVSGNRFTYKVKTPQQRKGKVSHFVSLMTGSDNETDFAYLGQLYNDTLDFAYGSKSNIGRDASSVRVISQVLHRLLEGTALPPTIEVWHEARCGRCGRKLTVPSSIASGFGPECINHV